MALILMFSLGAPSPGQDEDVIKVDTVLVTVNVSVTDTKNRHRPGLKPEDFLVTDEGKAVKSDFFDSDGPASIVFVIDVSSSMQGSKWQNLKTGLKRFLSSGDKGNDYTLIAFNEQPRLVAASVNSRDLWKEFSRLRPFGDTALYDGVLRGLSALERASHRHKALVLFSDGDDNCSQAGLMLVQQEVFAHRATIYPVGILLDESSSSDRANGKELLNELAAATGGFALFPTSDRLQEALNMINADVSNQYSFSYYPPEKAPGWRNVRVRLLQDARRLNLRYQKRYLIR